MNVFIVDDERPARDRLKELLSRMNEVKICGEADNGYTALDEIPRSQPDIVLMDIRMPQIDGLEVAGKLAELNTPPALIFTTAYDEHAIQAFEAKAVAYLLKPVRLEHLAKALNNARALNRAQLTSLRHADDQLPPDNKPGGRGHLSTRLGNRLELIPIDDVYYLQAEQKYVTVRHRNGEAVIEESLKSLQAEFGERFLRVHRNALVALHQVGGLERVPPGRYQVTLKETGERLEVSRRLVSRVRKALAQL